MSTAWPLIAATALLAAAWMAASGLGFDWGSALSVSAICLLLEGGAHVYRTRRPEPRISATLSCLSQLIAFSAVAALLSYAVARTGGALWDDRLHAADLRLGLDWRAYLAFVDGHPTLGLVLGLAYRSLIAQFILLAIVLGFTGRLRELETFITAFALAGLAAIMLSGLMPAMAMYVHLGLTPQDYPNVDPSAAFVHVADMTGLRDGTLRAVSLDRLEGIITFPSMHASLGVLFGHAFWKVRLARVPMAVLNVLLVAATPIDGGHYFVDVLAGGAIAAMAVAVASRIRSASAGATSLGPAPATPSAGRC